MAPRGGGLSKIFKKPLAYRVQNQKYLFGNQALVSQKLARDSHTGGYWLKLSGVENGKLYSNNYYGITMDKLRDAIPQHMKAHMLFFTMSRDVQREYNCQLFEQFYYNPFPRDRNRRSVNKRGTVCQLVYYLYHGSCYLKDRFVNWMGCNSRVSQ